MAKIIDARKLSCPEPVILTRQALDNDSEVITIVDNETARENVSRLGKSTGCEVAVDCKQDGIYLTLKKTGETGETQDRAETGTVLFIGSDIVGRGENIALGTLLMQIFTHNNFFEAEAWNNSSDE